MAGNEKECPKPRKVFLGLSKSSSPIEHRELYRVASDLKGPLHSGAMKKTKVLFVCLGNICRSPTAEAIFRKMSAAHGEGWHFDSAGTANYHVGERSDQRSIHHAEKRGYRMTHLARQVQVQDFEIFDWIFAMDQKNLKHLMDMSPEAHREKVKLVTEYCQGENPGLIPDPYYGGEQDFELVLDLLEDAATEFFKKHK